jgi:hypothetical protein
LRKSLFLPQDDTAIATGSMYLKYLNLAGIINN